MFRGLSVAGLAALIICTAASGAEPAGTPSGFSNDQIAAVIEALPADPATDPPPNDTPAPRSVQSLVALVAAQAADEAADVETDCLARAVYFEAKGEPLEGQLAVAQVIRNRAASGRFATTLCGVIKQPSQFSFVHGGVIPPVQDAACWRRAVAIARISQASLRDSVVGNALYFHARRVSPGWGKQQVAALGNHIFYR